jgi:hypothetical protein
VIDKVVDASSSRATAVGDTPTRGPDTTPKAAAAARIRRHFKRVRERIQPIVRQAETGARGAGIGNVLVKAIVV